MRASIKRTGASENGRAGSRRFNDRDPARYRSIPFFGQVKNYFIQWAIDLVALALFVVFIIYALACGNDSSPVSPGVVVVPPEGAPVPPDTYPGAPVVPVPIPSPIDPPCDEARLAARDLAGVCRASPATMGALEAT